MTVIIEHTMLLSGNDWKARLVLAYLSSSFLLLSTENLYWNPEQPPPSTCILRYSPFPMISSSLWIKGGGGGVKAREMRCKAQKL